MDLNEITSVLILATEKITEHNFLTFRIYNRNSRNYHSVSSLHYE